MVKRLTNPLAERATPLGNLLAASAQRLSSELTLALHEAGFEDLRAAHAPVFQMVDPAGTRASVLAQRTGMTKQAMGELLEYLMGRGYLRSVSDPRDGRARLIQVTPRGWAAVDTAISVIDDFDAWLVAVLGENELTALRQALSRVMDARRSDWLASPSPPRPRSRPAAAGRES